MRSGLALSIKQPWAALIVAGRKRVEVRRWPTRVRGPIVIHAARIPDARPQAWHWVTDDLRPAAALVGGVVGMANLAECLVYRDTETFVQDTHRHLNDPDWFESPLYGFHLVDAHPVPFRVYPGNIKFFPVTPAEEPS